MSRTTGTKVSVMAKSRRKVGLHPLDVPSEVGAKEARRVALTADLERAREREKEAQAALTHALTDGRGDVDGLSDARNKAERWVRDLTMALDALVVEIPTAREAAALERAGAFVAKVPGTVTRLLGTITDTQRAAREQAAALAATLRAEQDARAEWGVLPALVKVLKTRFPALEVVAVPPAPDAEDVLAEPLRVSMDPRRFRLRFDVAHAASADADQRRRDDWKALAVFLDRHAHALPPEVAAIFDLAPPPAWDTPEDKSRREAREKEQRASAAKFAGEVAPLAAAEASRRKPEFGG